MSIFFALTTPDGGLLSLHHEKYDTMKIIFFDKKEADKACDFANKNDADVVVVVKKVIITMV